MKEISMKITTSNDVLIDQTSTIGRLENERLAATFRIDNDADIIERLENELIAATIRIDNDAMEITRLTPLQYRQAPCHKFCEATAFQIEIQALKAERDAAVAESLEQARLLGMGSEREAALLGKVDRLERDKVYMQADIDELRERIKSLNRCIGGFEGITRDNIELRAELSKVTDELFALSQDDGKVERALDRANTEIKRLHAELDALKNQEPYGFWWEADGTFNIGQEPSMSTKAGPCSGWKITPLFLAPGAQPVKTGRAMVPKESS